MRSRNSKSAPMLTAVVRRRVAASLCSTVRPILLRSISSGLRITPFSMSIMSESICFSKTKRREFLPPYFTKPRSVTEADSCSQCVGS